MYNILHFVCDALFLFFAACDVFLLCSSFVLHLGQLLTVEERKIGLQGFSDHWLESGMQLDHSKYAEKVSESFCFFFLCVLVVDSNLLVYTLLASVFWAHDRMGFCFFPPPGFCCINSKCASR